MHANNAIWWNEQVPWYAERDEAWATDFLKNGDDFLFESEKQLLGNLSTWCKRACHLQCSRGDDAISLWRLGAEEVVGVDISDGLLTVARRKAANIGANVSFILADVIELPSDLDNSFDLVYTGKGAVCWMMDIQAWAMAIAQIMKPNGVFFIHEGHPLDMVWDSDASDYVIAFDVEGYFTKQHFHKLFSSSNNDVIPAYKQWTLSDIINSLISAGMIIERFEEYPTPFWQQFPNMTEEILKRLPHSFAIRARKG